jgi:hypothetical protein
MAARGTLTGNKKAEKKAAQMLAAGATLGKVGQAVGVSESRVCRWANKDESREWIEREQRRYLELVPDAIDYSNKLIKAGNAEAAKIGDDDNVPDYKLLEIAQRETESVKKSAGILPSHTNSMIINNIYNDNRGAMLVPSVQSLLDRLSGAEIDVSPDME